MAALIECIPNISEGRREDVVREIREAAVKAGPGVLLLDSTSDHDHNRSVLTYLGDGPALLGAMTALVEAALARIDLRTHQGAHPRLGAVDVIPFVPIRGATSADCVACINANAGSAANAQTCATLSATCTAACGFGDG